MWERLEKILGKKSRKQHKNWELGTKPRKLPDQKNLATISCLRTARCPFELTCGVLKAKLRRWVERNVSKEYPNLLRPTISPSKQPLLQKINYIRGRPRSGRKLQEIIQNQHTNTKKISVQTGIRIPPPLVRDVSKTRGEFLYPPLGQELSISDLSKTRGNSYSRGNS